MKNFFTIIGGMGTMATESYIHQLNLRTPANNDQEYLNYILVNHATVPDRTAYILDNSKPNPKIPLLEDFKQQASLKPDFFTLPCNTAHYFYDELQAAVDVPVLHMPRLAVEQIKKDYPNAKRVGIVATNGTLHDGVYDKDPNKFADAKKYDKLTYMEVIEQGLQVMDTTATTLCMDNNIPILVFGISEEGNIKKVMEGEKIGTIVSK